MTSQGSDRLGSDRLGGRGPAQPLADPAANNEDEYAETGAVADTTGEGLRPRSSDPQTGRGPDTGPHTGEQGVSPDRDTAGRSGADTGAGSLPKTGMARGRSRSRDRWPRRYRHRRQRRAEPLANPHRSVRHRYRAVRRRDRTRQARLKSPGRCKSFLLALALPKTGPVGGPDFGVQITIRSYPCWRYLLYQQQICS